MQVDIESDLTVEEAFFDDLTNWTLSTGLWDGRSVTVEEAGELQERIEKKLLAFLAFQDPSSIRFQKMAATLAMIGACENEKESLLKEIEESNVFSNRHFEQIGLRKSLKKKWKKHKKKILIGAAIVVVVTVVVAVSVCSAGSAAPAAGAGAAALGCLSEEEKKKKRPKPDKKPDPVESDPPLPQSLTVPISFEKEGIIVNDQHHSYEEILDLKHRQALVASFHGKESSHLESSLPRLSSQFGIESRSLEKPLAAFSKPEYSQDRILSQASREVALGQVYPDVFKPSKTPFAEELAKLPPRKVELPRWEITGINGINTKPKDAESHKQYISRFIDRFIGRKVDWTYNKTHGFVIDTLEVLTGNYRGFSFRSGKELQAKWESFHERNKDMPELKLFQICHSQGALHVRNTLLTVPEEIRDRLIVIAIAPAAVVSKKLCHDSFNYASKKDIVHYGEVFSAMMRDSFFGLPPAIFNSLKAKELEDLKKAREELIFLDSHPDAKGILDHDFQSPTYQKYIERQIQIYIEKQGVYK